MNNITTEESVLRECGAVAKGEGKGAEGRDRHFWPNIKTLQISKVPWINQEVNVKEKWHVGERPFYFVLISMTTALLDRKNNNV